MNQRLRIAACLLAAQGVFAAGCDAVQGMTPDNAAPIAAPVAPTEPSTDPLPDTINVAPQYVGLFMNEFRSPAQAWTPEH